VHIVYQIGDLLSFLSVEDEKKVRVVGEIA